MTTGTKNVSSPFFTSSKNWNGTDKAQTGGLKVPHYYHVSANNWYHGSFSAKYNWVNQVFNMKTMCGTGSQAPSTWSSNDDLKLRSKLIDKIKDHDFNPSVAGAEVDKTFRMIADGVTGVSSGIRALRDGKLPDAILSAMGKGYRKTPPTYKYFPAYLKKHKGEIIPELLVLKGIKVSAASWLAYSYGISPLLQDVHAGAQALAKHNLGLQETDFTVVRGNRNTVNGNNGNITWVSQTDHSKRLIVKLAREVTLSSIWDNLGVIDPLQVIWERTYLSFIVDWFLPVGSFLNVLHELPRLSGSWILTDRLKQRTETNIIEIPDNPYYAGYGDVNRVRMTPQLLLEIHLTRSCGAGSLSGLSVPLPSFKSPMSPSWKRAANAIAVAVALASSMTPALRRI